MFCAVLFYAEKSSFLCKDLDLLKISCSTDERIASFRNRTELGNAETFHLAFPRKLCEGGDIMGHTDDVLMDLTPLHDTICAAGNLNIHCINQRKGDSYHENNYIYRKQQKFFQ